MRGAWFLHQAVRGMRANPLIQAATIGSIAMGFLLVGLAVLLAFNVERLTSNWGQGTHVTAYLRPGAREDRVDALRRLLKDRPEVTAIKHVNSRQARQRLRESLGHRADLLHQVEPDFFPPSLELRLAPDADLARVRALVALLGQAEGVEEVDHLGRWSDRLGALVELLRRASLTIALIVAIACLCIVATTIRLGVHARREAIEIQKLVGATDGFVRTPFLIEGAIQGLLGTLFAGGLLYVLFRAASAQIAAVSTPILGHLQLSFLSVPHLVLGVVGGALLGVLGSSLALGRYAEV